MAKKTQDLKPDTVLKNYWNDNEQFADLFNAVLFDGKQVIKPVNWKMKIQRNLLYWSTGTIQKALGHPGIT